jgi:type IV secretory pathway VirB2 component (pilin)
MKHIASSLSTLMAAALCAAPVLAGYDIESHGSTGGSIFTRLVNGLQDLVDFMDGPLAIGVVLIGLVVAGALWVFAPDNRHLGKAMKAVAVGFVLFDMGLLINYLSA